MKTYTHKSARSPGHARERGAILIVSLLILLVLTLLGLTGLSNMTIEERMAGNYQQRTIAFQAAESKISEVLFKGSPESETNPGTANPQYQQERDPFQLKMLAAATGTDPYPTTELIDTYDVIPNADVAVMIDMEYLGVNPGAKLIAGNELGGDLGAHAFEISANATYVVSDVTETARSNHRLHALIIGPTGSGGRIYVDPY